MKKCKFFIVYSDFVFFVLYYSPVVVSKYIDFIILKYIYFF